MGYLILSYLIHANRLQILVFGYSTAPHEFESDRAGVLEGLYEGGGVSVFLIFAKIYWYKVLLTKRIREIPAMLQSADDDRRMGIDFAGKID